MISQLHALAQQPYATRGWALYKDFKGSLKGPPLTLMSPFVDDPIELYEQGPEWTAIPRALCPIGEKDYRHPGFPVPVHMEVTARSQEQHDALKQLSADMTGAPHQSGIYVAPTGFGKTVLGCAAIALAQTTTCVIVHKQDLVEQWQEAFSKFLGMGASVWQGDKTPSSPLVIAMVQSICKAGRYKQEFYDPFGMIIVDEVHRMAATEFRKAVPNFPATRRLGFSATPKRLDGLEGVFHAHMGPVLHEAHGVPMPPKIYCINTGFVPWSGNMKIVNPKPGRMNHADKLLRTNGKRNALILKMILRLHELGRKIVVFSATKAHLYTLANDIHGDIPHGFYIGGKKPADLAKAALQPICFATYKMCAEGTDKPWWDACVLASPLAHIVQPVGRVTRFYPDKEQPIVVDFVDSHHLWQAYATCRQKEYAAMGAEIDV